MKNDVASLVTMTENMAGMQIVRGRISAISPDGKIFVENEIDRSCLACDFLRTSAAPLPILTQGDLVLYIFDETLDRGYVLGLIQRYIPEEEVPHHLKFYAKAKIELRCGKSSLTMDREGKVIIKGAQLVSRASGVNKIKGAAVKIN